MPKPRRTGRLLLPTLEGEEPDGAGASAAGVEGSRPAAHRGIAVTSEAPVVAAAARLMQHPMLLAHFLAASGDAAGAAGLGCYQGHAPLRSATVLQGAEGLRGAHFARGFALRLPLLLVTQRAAVLFSAGGLEAVLVLPLALTGAPASGGLLYAGSHPATRAAERAC